MNVQSALELIGDDSVHRYPWCDKLLTVINAALPNEQRVTVVHTGAEITAKLIALPLEIKNDILNRTFDLGALANEGIDQYLTEAAADPVKAKSLKFKVLIGMLIFLAGIVLVTVAMAVATSVRSGAPIDTAAIETTFKLLMQILAAIVGL